MYNDKSCCIFFPTYLFFFLLRAAGSSSSLYSRGILEKGEKTPEQSAEPQGWQGERTVPQTQQSTEVLKDGAEQSLTLTSP